MVLGFIWDDSGYEEDDQIWGGEVFLFERNQMTRVAHLEYFLQLPGDKMCQEPRLSALSLLNNFPWQEMIEKYFSPMEWTYFQRFLSQPAGLLTSSMFRLLDVISAILDICIYNSYDGEVTLKLEARARNATELSKKFYAIPLINNRLDFCPLLSGIMEDMLRLENTDPIARKEFLSWVDMVEKVALHFNVDMIAFSGSVLQSALLNTMLSGNLANIFTLYFQKQLSPNDENIGFGQIACL